MSKQHTLKKQATFLIYSPNLARAYSITFQAESMTSMETQRGASSDEENNRLSSNRKQISHPHPVRLIIAVNHSFKMNQVFKDKTTPTTQTPTPVSTLV